MIKIAGEAPSRGFTRRFMTTESEEIEAFTVFCAGLILHLGVAGIRIRKYA
jgi:hypothetical protein